MTKNTLRQPKAWASQPISGANSTVAKYWAELKMAEAVPRSLPGNQAATMRALAGKGRRLGEADQEAQREQDGDRGGAGEEADQPCMKVNSDQSGCCTA